MNLDYILAKAFACSNDIEQANLLNEIARELFVRCGGRHQNLSEGLYGYEWQCCGITKHLNKDGMDFIEDLYESIQLRKKEINE